MSLYNDEYQTILWSTWWELGAPKSNILPLLYLVPGGTAGGLRETIEKKKDIIIMITYLFINQICDNDEEELGEVMEMSGEEEEDVESGQEEVEEKCVTGEKNRLEKHEQKEEREENAGETEAEILWVP